LEWVRARLSVVEPIIAGPILFSPDGDDPTWSDADDDHYALLSVDDPWGA
jgi:hypothetical protein